MTPVGYPCQCWAASAAATSHEPAISNAFDNGYPRPPRAADHLGGLRGVRSHVAEGEIVVGSLGFG